jgi:two-component sensor histidine kinase
LKLARTLKLVPAAELVSTERVGGKVDEVAACITLELDAVPACARIARRHVAEHLSLPATLASHVDLIIGELVANAILHAAPPIRLTVTFDNVTVHIEVHDGDPELRSPAVDSRGLAIVRHLATDSGITTNGRAGTSVWADITAHQQAAD